MKSARMCFLSLLLVPNLLVAGEQTNNTGFLVIAPDRGFLGNEEIREAFDEYKKWFNASLVFITREETARFLREGIAHLEKAGAKELVVVPMFPSAHHPLYKHAMIFLESTKEHKLASASRSTSSSKSDDPSRLTALPVKIAETMSRNYLIGEILADRIAALSKQPEKEALAIVAQGASTDEERSGIESDVKSIINQIRDRYQFAEETIVVLKDPEEGGRLSWDQLEKELAAIRSKNLVPVLIPFDLTQKADGMMSLRSSLYPVAKKYNAAYDGADLTPHPNVALWLAEQSNAHVPITKDNLGVVFMPHGSNYNWNRTMMDAIEPLQSKYNIEPAFTMGDPALIERAVTRLEMKGARAIVVVRVFSLESSFSNITEYVLGLRDRLDHEAHGHGSDADPPPRIRSGSVFYTVGGVEASPLFAEALLDRVLEVSRNPKKETIILLAHGTESEESNKHWEDNLAKIASHMRVVANQKGRAFRAIQYATWREDWPELREKAIQKIRAMVQKASEDSGTAIVIPARTARGGREEEWLKGLNYVYNGNGFAPHPKFVQWMEEQIQIALEYFNKRDVPARILSTPSPSQHQHSGKH